MSPPPAWTWSWKTRRTAARLAEVWFGVRRDLRNVVVVTVSEGIGTGIFANGHYGKAVEFSELLALADRGDSRAVHALDQMARWLGRGAAMLATGLAPESLIFVGELTSAWPRFGPAIESELSRTERSGTRVVPAGDGATPRLRGAAALILEKRFGVSSLV